MTDLVTWLRAQLDEDEQETELTHVSDCPSNLLTQTDEELYQPPDPCRCTSACPARRPLAELVAKRAILDEHKPWNFGQRGEEEHCCRCMRLISYEWRYMPSPCPTIRLLALPYADHEGYREEWRP